MDRRTLVRSSMLTAVGMLIPVHVMAAAECTATTLTDQGPLYPEKNIPWGNDLTQVSGVEGIAKGQPVIVFGQVKSPDCQVIPDTVVEIWQADDSGYYDHSLHPAPGGLDPSFKYFSKVRTDAHGRYFFKTIMPKWYRIFDIDRAAHIHFKVVASNQKSFITEMYFEGAEQDKLRQKDRVFQGISSDKKSLVIHSGDFEDFPEYQLPEDDTAMYCHFDLIYS